MAWYSDEEYEFRQDCGLKKHIAASAHKQRTHCGKGGCSLPSDNMTKKEIKAMNGECVTYKSVKRPMNWEEFKKLPDDLKKEYVNFMRDTFDVPDVRIAGMFNIHPVSLGKYFRMWGLSRNEKRPGTKKWNEHEFDVWRGAILELPEVPVAEKNPAVVAMESFNNMDDDQKLTAIRNALGHSETPVEAVDDAEVKELDKYVNYLKRGSKSCVERKRAIPANGKMTFDGPIEGIVETLRMLLGGVEVTLDVAWTVVEPDIGVGRLKEE